MPEPAYPGYLNVPNSNDFLVSGKLAMERFEVMPPSIQESNEHSQALVRRHVSPLFISVAISPDERHLIVGSAFSLLYLIPDFIRIGKKYNTVEEVVQRIHVGSPIMNITWGPHERRFALSTDDGYTFLFELDATYHDPRGAADPSDPGSIALSGALVHRLADFRMTGFNGLSVNLQMTRTRLWVGWDGEVLQEYLQTCQKSRIEECLHLSTLKKTNASVAIVPLPAFTPHLYTASICYVDFASSLHRIQRS